MADIQITYTKTEAADDTQASRKRKTIQNKLTSCSELITNVQPDAGVPNETAFIVQSESDKSKLYHTKVFNNANGINFECNCGDQWNINPRRNNCKHIGGMIANLLKTYVENHNKNGCKHQKNTKNSNARPYDDSDNDDIDNIIDKFKNLMAD